ncbi:uncharacterized protein LOC129590326 isoform X2 [Paramacrobiotus metropolitanus]|uniref:uncharacterized protein LOC129590326 isoform X2 n=1 Tax=Paramacrobiotus metropolitanus TaxID=2943436 RepID=UPI002445D017|nr:uncharacterized protein LOC129590326 isoform X2 [Paramacrobiotus metropolitanus]
MNRLPGGAPHGDAVSPSTSRIPSADVRSPKTGAQPTAFVRRVIDSHNPDELNRTPYIGQSDALGPSTSIHRAAGFSSPPTPAPKHFAPLSRHDVLQQQTAPSSTMQSSAPAQQHYQQSHADHTHVGPTKAFDRLAFRAVSQTFNDLRDRGILLISDDSAQRNVPFQLSPSVAKFFMTDSQEQQHAPQDPTAWPALAHSDATRQGYHVQLGRRENPVVQHQSQVVHSEDFMPLEAPPTIYPRTEAQADDKIRMMLKYLVKYTNHGFNGPWIKKFLSRNLQTESRELRTIFDSMHMIWDMEQYWDNLQRRRYATHFRWVYKFAPINVQMWAKKQLYKLQWPTRYLRQKALWQAASLGGEIQEIVHKVYPNITQEMYPSTEEAVMLAAVDVGDLSAPTETKDALETSFADWIQTSAANLSVTISYAWNELREDGVLHKDSMELAPQEAELLTALRNLDAAIKDYGVHGVEIGQEGALEYAKVVLRFTQGLHDYLEMKEHGAQLQQGFMVTGGQIMPLGALEGAPGVEAPKETMAHAMPQEPTVRIRLAQRQESGLESEDSLATDAERDQLSTDLGTESEMESTKRALTNEPERQYRNAEAPMNMNAQENLLSDETRARLLRSARLDFYEKHRSPSLSPLRRAQFNPEAPLHTESVFEDDRQYATEPATGGKIAEREEPFVAQLPEGQMNLAGQNSKGGKEQTGVNYEGHAHEQRFNLTEAPERHIVI